MKTALLILQKDLRRYAWAWLAVFAIAAIEVYLHGTAAGMAESSLNDLLGFFASVIGGILVFVLFVMVVQEENLADPDAYWLGRPFNRLQILAAKLAFIVLILLLFAASEALTLVLNGGASQALFAFGSVLSGLALWQGIVFLAAQTRSLPRFLLLVVGLVVGLYALSFAMMFFAFSQIELGNPGQLPADISPRSLALIQTLFWLLWGFLLLALYYRRRKRLHAWLLLLPGIFFAVLLTPRDSFVGVRMPFERESPEPELLEIHPTGARRTINQVGYHEYAALLEWEKPALDGDLWATLQYASLSSDEDELDIDQTQSTRRVDVERDGEMLRFELDLGLLEAEKVEALGSEVRLSLSLTLSESEQVEIARVPLDGSESVRYEGGRLALRSFSQFEGRLQIDLAAYRPDFLDRPKSIRRGSEPLRRQFRLRSWTRRPAPWTPCDLRHS